MRTSSDCTWAWPSQGGVGAAQTHLLDEQAALDALLPRRPLGLEDAIALPQRRDLRLGGLEGVVLIADPLVGRDELRVEAGDLRRAVV